MLIPPVSDIVLGILCANQWLKVTLGLRDGSAEIVCFLVGAALGGLYQYTVTPNEWLKILIGGIAISIISSGLYKLIMALRNGSPKKPPTTFQK